MRRDALPGFRLTLGVTVGYLSILILLPLGALFWRAGSLTPGAFVHAVTGHRALMAYALSFGASLAAALINVVFGIVVAWVLVRYRFWGRGIVDALVDIPFALPTAVAGIALTAIYSENGPVGRVLPLAFSRAGVVIALVFVSLPFVIRTVQPVLHDLDPSVEEAAAVLGAGRARIFFRVILPSLLPALYTGFALAFARALGEYGSVVFISGNLPNRTEIIPLLIVTKLEQYDYGGATAIASVMLLLSFAILFGINALQAKRLR